MSDGIQERDVETYADDELEYNAKLGIFARIPASTTQRRVGRSTKTPPGPSFDDAVEGDASDSASGAQDEIGSVLISRLDELIKTPVGLSKFFAALDGQCHDERSPADNLALEGMMEDLHGSYVLTIPVLKLGQSTAPQSVLGGEFDVRADIQIEDGRPVLWVSNGLIAEERLDEIILCLAGEIEMTAFENSVHVDPGGISRLLHALYDGTTGPVG